MRNAAQPWLRSPGDLPCMQQGVPMVPLVLLANAFGQSLTNAPAPDGAGFADQLADVARLADDDVWVVGNTRNFDDTQDSLAAHWDGTDWEVTPTPNGPLSENWVTGVAALSDSDVWGV